MNIITVMMSPPSVQLRMPKESEPIVEEICVFPFRGFVASLCFNLLLITVCSFYAFKSRHLPDNFNESRYIALCVYTTLVIWTVFLPSYFVNNRAFHQMVLLSSATLLNGSVTLLCLYIPRIYATYKNEDSGKFSYRTSSLNQHEMDKCSRVLPKNGTRGGVAVCILHASNSRPSLDGSTKRQSFSDSDEGLEPLKCNEPSSSTA